MKSEGQHHMQCIICLVYIKCQVDQPIVPLIIKIYGEDIDNQYIRMKMLYSMQIRSINGFYKTQGMAFKSNLNVGNR